MTAPRQETEASRLRRDLAVEVAERCPPDLASEIAITGSVARGIADEYSDIELNLWADTIPARQTRSDWLRDAGFDRMTASGIIEPDGSEWQTAQYGGIWFEVGWAQLAGTEELVARLAAGEATSSRSLAMGATLTEALTLRSAGALARWQGRLRRYPETLVERIIRDNTEVWSDPHVPGVRWALAKRGCRMPLAQRQLWDLQNVLAILFALNRTWQPDLKWTDPVTLDLPVAPANLSERVNAVFEVAGAFDSIEICYGLAIEALDLVPASYDVSAARASIANALEANRGHR